MAETTESSNELIRARTELRAAEAELNQMRLQIADQRNLEIKLDQRVEQVQRLQETRTELQQLDQAQRRKIAELETQLEQHRTLHQQIETLEQTVAVLTQSQEELKAQLEQTEQARKEADQALTQTKKELEEQEKLAARQFLVDQQLERLHAQMDLVKDVLLRDG